jgi:hypothetical protein
MSLAGGHWIVTNRASGYGSVLADRHYSRQTVGARQFLPPGQVLVLVTALGDAVFGWHRPKPGIARLDGLDGWCCSIFRNEGAYRSSELILEAEQLLVEIKQVCGPDGLFTYVEPNKLQSSNPGYCFQMAGWIKTDRWSQDHRQRLLRKPWPGA